MKTTKVWDCEECDGTGKLPPSDYFSYRIEQCIESGGGREVGDRPCRKCDGTGRLCNKKCTGKISLRSNLHWDQRSESVTAHRKREAALDDDDRYWECDKCGRTYTYDVGLDTHQNEGNSCRIRETVVPLTLLI